MAIFLFSFWAIFHCANLKKFLAVTIAYNDNDNIDNIVYKNNNDNIARDVNIDNIEYDDNKNVEMKYESFFYAV